MKPPTEQPPEGDRGFRNPFPRKESFIIVVMTCILLVCFASDTDRWPMALTLIELVRFGKNGW